MSTHRIVFHCQGKHLQDVICGQRFALQSSFITAAPGNWLCWDYISDGNPGRPPVHPHGEAESDGFLWSRLKQKGAQDLPSAQVRGNTPGNQGSGGSNLLVQCPPRQIWDTYRQMFLQNGKKCPCSKTMNLYLKSSLYCLTFYGLQWKLCLTKDHRSEPLLMCIWKKSSVSLFQFHSNLHKSGHFYTNSSHLLLVTGTRGSSCSPYSLMTWHVLCYLSLNKGTLKCKLLLQCLSFLFRLLKNSAV